MRTLANKRGDRVAVAGLAIGGIFGMAGSFVTQAQLRQLFWMLDGVGIARPLPAASRSGLHPSS